MRRFAASRRGYRGLAGEPVRLFSHPDISSAAVAVVVVVMVAAGAVVAVAATQP